MCNNEFHKWTHPHSYKHKYTHSLNIAMPTSSHNNLALNVLSWGHSRFRMLGFLISSSARVQLVYKQHSTCTLFFIYENRLTFSKFKLHNDCCTTIV